MKNVLIVDDHPLLLEILGAVARNVFPDARIRTAENCEEALEAVHSDHDAPDLVLLDLGLPGCAGITALERLREAQPSTRVVVVSSSEERELILAALEAGAAGYIPKTSRPEVFTAALRLVAAGGIYVPPQALRAEIPAAVVYQSRKTELTERQRDVLRLIAKGMGNKEIARSLRIAKDTVKQHAKAVYAALGVAGRAQAARAAETRGIKLD
jgi:DNA-binding NarL/FixJ family response regulator